MVTRSMLRPAHISLGVSDLDASVGFYRDVLELPVERDGDMARIEWDDFLIVLELAPPTSRGKFHFGFRVNSLEEVDRWAARVRGAGGVVSGPADREGGRAVFFNDPDHFAIEIYYES